MNNGVTATAVSLRQTSNDRDQRVADLTEKYRAVRSFTAELCQSLVPEDLVIQSMPDASPAKWHLAHTSWFFETFILKPWMSSYHSEVPQYAYLFNSYYNAAGEMHRRDLRGLISRPTVKETYQYRSSIDECVTELIQTLDSNAFGELEQVLTLGLHHEQQHQELLVTDIKHVFGQNPLYPVFREKAPGSATRHRPAASDAWLSFDEEITLIGHSGQTFFYDNEGPRHRALVPAFELNSRLVTNGEYLAFMEARAYQRPEFWLALGWTTVNEQRWQAPLYWEKHDGAWWNFTLSGFRQVDADEPVTHISQFEADAYARWAGARLPTEFEWERAASGLPMDGNFVETGEFHPQAVNATDDASEPRQMFGDVWEWTRSAYLPYPGYRSAPGALGEYNGKFMCNQMVLRGGSCATSRTHIRPTYRNFFAPDKRWQFSGIRLARDPA